MKFIKYLIIIAILFLVGCNKEQTSNDQPKNDSLKVYPNLQQAMEASGYQGYFPDDMQGYAEAVYKAKSNYLEALYTNENGSILLQKSNSSISSNNNYKKVKDLKVNDISVVCRGVDNFIYEAAWKKDNINYLITITGNNKLSEATLESLVKNIGN